MHVQPQPVSTPLAQYGWLRVALAATLLVAAGLWPTLEWETFPHGPVLFITAPAHGLVASDFLSLVPFALAISVLLPVLRRAQRRSRV